jgi:hypothetical protein
MRVLTALGNALVAIGTVLAVGIGLLFLTSIKARADFLELREANVECYHLWDGGVDPLITQNRNVPNRTLGERVALNLSTRLNSFVYWDSRVHSSTDRILLANGGSQTGQFRLVGLELSLGLQVTDGLRIGYYHHSQHVLDAMSSFGPFPREDGLEIKFLLYKNTNSPDSLF